MSWTKRLWDIALVFVSVLMALLLVELLIRSFFPQNLSGSWLINHASGLILNKSEGTSRHEYAGVSISYRFGEYHNRKTEKQGSTKTGIPKLLILGDSFTFGFLLPDGRTYVDRLQQHLFNKYEIINSATGGWGTADYAKYIEVYCNKIKPEEIYIFFNNFDIGRSIKSSLYTLNDKDQIEIEATQIELNQPDYFVSLKKIANNFPKLYQFLLENSHLVQMVRNILVFRSSNNINSDIPSISSLKTSKDVEESSILGKELFLKIKNDAKQCEADLKIFNLVSEDISSQPEINLNGRIQHFHTIHFLTEAKKERFFSKNEITFFDLTNTKAMKEVFAEREKFIIRGDLHPNELGAERIFLATLESLNSQQ